MRHIVSATLGLCLAVAGAAGAETIRSRPGVVVELYTSQGCSSCPPADEFFSDLVRDPDVIPLALHVDYWDYIGWKDKFADPNFTARQKSYARAIGSRTVYTPQMIVGGVDRVEGNQPAEVEAHIRRHAGAASKVDLSVSRTGDTLSIHAEALQPLEGPMRVQLVRYRPEETVAIESGENAGRTVTYRNIVTSWQPLGEWSGDGVLEIDAAAPGTDPAVVIVQTSGPAAIVAAAQID